MVSLRDRERRPRMEFQSPFEGRLVRLRAREVDDLERYQQWLNDAEVTQYVMMRYPISVTQERRYLEDAGPTDFYSALFSIDTREGKHIGWCGLHNGSPEDRSASLGIAIGEKAYWNGGYGTDAMRVLCRFGFEQMNLVRIELQVFADNPRAQRVYEKIGFKVEGCRREADYRYGRYRDIVIMGLLREEFDASAGSAQLSPTIESEGVQ
jgi:RimJ/RimL family protein N-acetyltransferase